MTHSFPTRRSSDLGRTDHMNVDLETMAGEVAGNIRARSGAVAFGSGFRIHADDVDDGARICDIDEIPGGAARFTRSEAHTSELQSLMRIQYAVFCLKKTTPSSR